MRFILPLLFLVIAGSIFFWYIDPTYTHITDLRAQESQYDEALTKARELQNVRDSLLARYNTFSQSDLAHLQKLLPDHIDNVRLILDLDSMANRYGMRIRNVTVDTGDTGNTTTSELKASGVGGVTTASQQLGPSTIPYESVVIAFTVTGSYDTFRQYLSDLEKSLRIVDINEISFTPNDIGIYDFTVHLKTYWLKP